MTPEQVAAIAQEAGFYISGTKIYSDACDTNCTLEVQEVVRLVVAAEREACAVVARRYADAALSTAGNATALNIEAAIRARGTA